MPERRLLPSATTPIFRRPIVRGNVAVVGSQAPTVTINQAVGQDDPAYVGPILFDVVFSEPVTGFTAADVVLSGTAGATSVRVIGSGAVYTVIVGVGTVGDPVIMYDTRNYDGGVRLYNEGTTGAVWDLPIGSNGFEWWGRKLLNHGSGPDTPPYPSSFDDLGGDWCSGGFLFVTALGNGIRQPNADIYCESEWYIGGTVANNLDFSMGAYVDNFNHGWAWDPGGNFLLASRDGDNNWEWYPDAEFDLGFSVGAQGGRPEGALIAMYLDVATREARVWRVTRSGLVLVATATIEEDVADDSNLNTDGDCVSASEDSTGVDDLFWSLGYHGGHNLVPGMAWNGVVGMALYHTIDMPSEAELLDMYDFWYPGPDVVLLDHLDNGTTVDSPAGLSLFWDSGVDRLLALIADPVNNRVTRLILQDPTNIVVDDSLQDNTDLDGVVDIIFGTGGNDSVALVPGTNSIAYLELDAPMLLSDVLTDGTYLLNPEAFCPLDDRHLYGVWFAVVASGYLSIGRFGTASIHGAINIGAQGRPHYYQDHETNESIVIVSNGTGLSSCQIDLSFAEPNGIPTEIDTVTHANLADIVDVAVSSWAWATIYAYTVSTSNNILGVVDISDPNNISYVTAVTGLTCNPHRILIWSQSVVCVGATQVQIFDISDPVNPVLTATAAVQASGGADIYGDLLVTTGPGVSTYSLVGVNATSIPLMRPLGTIEQNSATANTWPAWKCHPHPTADVVYYSTEGEPRFSVVDVSDPDNPTQTIVTMSLDCSRNMLATTDRLYVMAHNPSPSTPYLIMTYDITDPLDPVLLTTGPDNLEFAEFMAFSSDQSHLFVSSWGGTGPFQAISLADPDNPALVDIISTAALNGAGQFALSASGDTAFVPLENGNAIALIDVSDPTNMAITGTVPMGDADLQGPYALVRNGAYLYVASWGGVLEPAFSVWQITGESTLTRVGKLVHDPDRYVLFAEQICNIGSYVFFATSGNNPWISCVDASDPTNPVLHQVLGPEHWNINSTIGIAAKDPYLYVVNANASFDGATAFGVLSFGE